MFSPPVKAKKTGQPLEALDNFQSIMTGEPNNLSDIYGQAVALRATCYWELCLTVLDALHIFQQLLHRLRQCYRKFRKPHARHVSALPDDGNMYFEYSLGYGQCWPVDPLFPEGEGAGSAGKKER